MGPSAARELKSPGMDSGGGLRHTQARMKSKAMYKKIRRLEAKLVKQHQKLSEMKRGLPLEPVEDYELIGAEGPVKLSALFGDKRDLIVVHNMGRSCPYCTLWADGFNGLRHHLESRAAFAVVSPDAPAAQRKFAASRGWKFQLLSGKESAFTADMGFMDDDGPQPGVSTFVKKRGKIFRVASAPFGPFDPFCSAWHFFALLDGGVGGWAPNYKL